MCTSGSRNRTWSGVLCPLALLIAISLATTGTAQDRPNIREELMMAEGEYLTGNYARARDRLDGVLNTAEATDSQKFEAVVLQARCLTQLEDSTRAINAFTEALKINPAWRPGAEDLKEPELALFEQALAGFETAQSLLALPPCPSKSTATVATVAFVASSVFYFAAKGGADDRWDEYQSDPIHPDNLYDDYESAKSKQDIAMIATAATGLASGYLWFRYAHTSRNCREVGDAGVRLGLQFGLQRLALVGRF